MKLSLVVPCYNEAGNLRRLHREALQSVAELDADVELVLVDDGSTDDTFAVAAQLADADPRVRVIGLSRNFGKEAAMLAGLRHADGDLVAIMDADLQHPPSLLRQMCEAIAAPGVEQVVARRDRSGEPAFRRLLARCYYRIVNGMVDEVSLQDGVGDFRLMSRTAVDALLQLEERNRFSKGLFSWIGFPTAVVPYVNVGRDTGESAWTLRTLLDYGVDGVLAFNPKPLRLLVYLGLLAFTVGLAYLVLLLYQWAVNGVETPGYITTVGLIVILGGLQLVALGVVGEYVGRIYQEVKQRPSYIVGRAVNVDRGRRADVPRRGRDADTGGARP